MTRAHTATRPDLRGEPPLVLTVRGRRVMLVALVLTVLLVAFTIRAVVSDASPVTKDPAASASTAANGTAGPQPSTASKVPSATPSPAASASTKAATTNPMPSPSVSSTTSTGIKRSGLVGTGKFSTSTWAKPAVRKTARLHTFVVKVEGGVRADPADVAQQVHAILNDPRGWTGNNGASFAAVAEPARADFTVYIASPPTTNRMCAPLKVGGKWSCAAGSKVVLNSDRWQLMTPTYADLADYRDFMVNHEVGHFLGKGHVGCPRAGTAAPVMLQQSISLRGCRPNAWPTTRSTDS